MCFLYLSTKACAIEALTTWRVCCCNAHCNTHCDTHCKTLTTWHVCCLHSARAALLSCPFSRRIAQFKVFFWTIRQQSWIREQICTCESFGRNTKTLAQSVAIRISCNKRCNGGNVKQDSICWVQTAPKSCGEFFNRTSFCIWVKRSQILAMQAVFAKVSIIPAPLYAHTVVVSHMRRPNSSPTWKDQILLRIFGTALIFVSYKTQHAYNMHVCICKYTQMYICIYIYIYMYSTAFAAAPSVVCILL